MFRPVMLLATAVVIVLSSAATGSGQTIATVEEEWELTVGAPNVGKSCPQIECVMSPFANIDSVYAMFLVNCRTHPTGEGGGLQVQIWNGQTLLAVGDFPDTASINAAGEKVTWTQRMNVKNGVMTFEITAGNSQTWGRFGGNNSQLVATAPVNVADLNAYDPNVSATQSGVGYGDNRTSKLMLRKVRTFTSNGKKSVEKALDRVVYPD